MNLEPYRPPNRRFEPRIDLIGAEGAPIVVLDDFYDDPPRLAAAAAAAKFQPVAGHLYPGVRAPAPEGYMRDLIAAVADVVRDAFGLGGFELAGCECDFSIVTTPPDRLRVLQCLPHFDTTDVRQIAVLHYLCGPEFGGTAFYRHRATGYESIDADRRESYLRALGAELKKAGGLDRRYMDGDTNLFERIASIDAMPNRILIYRSASLHSGRIGPACRFESDVLRGRLTVNAFLHFRERLAP